MVLIKTERNTKTVKKIINAKRNGGMSISPKETIKKPVKNFIKTKSKEIL